MRILKLSLEGFRNYEAATIAPLPALNVLLGDNAQGKTNCLEAIYYLANGHTFRGQKDAEMIRWDASYFRLQAEFQVEDSKRIHELMVYYDRQGRKHIKLNGVGYRTFAALPVRVRVVLFTPDDLTIVKGAPSLRRQFIDRDLDAYADGFYDLRRQYNRVLLQRNELLKDVRARRQPQSALAPWNNQLAALGSGMIRHRLDYLARLVPIARRMHGAITGTKGTFDVRYQSCLGQVLAMSQQELESRHLEIMRSCAGEEIRRGVSLYGPHRDDLAFYEKGADLRTYGSQGQQRTAVLAMKLGEVASYRHQFSQQPLLLLDDVMSELDSNRQNQLMGIILEHTIQTIITGTKLNDYGDQIENNPIFHIKEGKIIRNEI